MIHLTLPPFDYMSESPYIVSLESPPDAHIAETLSVAIQWFFPMIEGMAANTVARIVDRRGVNILGQDTHDLVGLPNLVATNEVLLWMHAHIDPSIHGTIEQFEMVVRQTYVILRGGT